MTEWLFVGRDVVADVVPLEGAQRWVVKLLEHFLFYASTADALS
jgi:hypothetical protein